MQQENVALPVEEASTEDDERPETNKIFNVPVLLTTLIGREDELVDLCTLLRQPDVRLLTLTGTGGVGKTSLGLAVANALQHDFPDGVCFVPLVSVSDPALVMPTIARTLGLHEETDTIPLKQLRMHLHEKHLLLLLDNFEQIVSAASSVAELLMACPSLRLLVTSRFALHLSGEYEYSVAPLTVPDPVSPAANGAIESAAVKLFVERAQALQPGFHMTPENARTIAEICVRLDGLPLAIELAAARIKLLPPQALLKRLERRLQVLTGGASDLPVRHQTLRNTLQWSYDLLNPDEQKLFRRLSVFVGGFTLQAAETLYAHLDGEGAEDVVLDGLASLIEKNLLQPAAQDEEDPHLSMLETIREFGLECLTASGELEATRNAHLQCFLTLAEMAALHVDKPDASEWMQRLEQDVDNFRAAMEWALETGRRTGNMNSALQLGIALGEFWFLRKSLREVQAFMEQALVPSASVSKALRAQALNLAAKYALQLEDRERAQRQLEESLTLFRELGDTAQIAAQLLSLGLIARRRGDFAQARVLFEESLALYTSINDVPGRMHIIFNLAYLAQKEGRYEQAMQLFQESLAYDRAMGDRYSVSSTLFQMALLLYESHTSAPVDEMQPLVDEGLAITRELGARGGEIYHQWMAACIAFSRGDLVKARSIAEECSQFCRQEGLRQMLTLFLLCLAKVNIAEGQYGDAQRQLEESLTIASAYHFVEHVTDCLMIAATLAVAQKQYGRAVRLLGACEKQREVTGTPLHPKHRLEYERNVTEARAFLGEKPFAALWAEGRALPPNEAFAAHELVRDRKDNRQPVPLAPKAPLYPAGLTVREVEILRLVAQGLTDNRIAEQLVLSRRTVTTHLTSIYNKLNVSSRAAATRYAVEHHLL